VRRTQALAARPGRPWRRARPASPTAPSCRNGLQTAPDGVPGGARLRHPRRGSPVVRLGDSGVARPVRRGPPGRVMAGQAHRRRRTPDQDRRIRIGVVRGGGRWSARRPCSASRRRGRPRRPAS